jgi:hypothetical protein
MNAREKPVNKFKSQNHGFLALLPASALCQIGTELLDFAQ